MTSPGSSHADALQAANGGKPSTASAFARMSAAYANTDETADLIREARVAMLDPSQRDRVAAVDPAWRSRLTNSDTSTDKD